jgi:hypothetical protein
LFYALPLLSIGSLHQLFPSARASALVLANSPPLLSRLRAVQPSPDASPAELLTAVASAAGCSALVPLLSSLLDRPALLADASPEENADELSEAGALEREQDSTQNAIQLRLQAAQALRHWAALLLSSSTSSHAVTASPEPTKKKAAATASVALGAATRQVCRAVLTLLYSPPLVAHPHAALLDLLGRLPRPPARLCLSVSAWKVNAITSLHGLAEANLLLLQLWELLHGGTQYQEARRSLQAILSLYENWYGRPSSLLLVLWIH